MRVRSSYVVTSALVAAALGAPFALPRLLVDHGSGGIVQHVLAPPAAPTAVVRMAALPQRKPVVPVRRVLVRARPRPSVSRAELATVRVHVPARTVPVKPATPVHRRPIRHHPPAPVESARAPEPSPAPAPAPTVVPPTPQPAALNSTEASPAPAAPAAPTPAPDPGADAPGHGHGNGNGPGNDNGNGRGQGHGHSHDD